MQGFRLIRGEYRPLEADASGRLHSTMLGLDLERDGQQLLFRDPSSGELIISPKDCKVRELEARNEQLSRELDELRIQRRPSRTSRRSRRRPRWAT